MRQFTQEQEQDDLVKSTVKNPPWGTEPQTPSTGNIYYSNKLTYKLLFYVISKACILLLLDAFIMII